MTTLDPHFAEFLERINAPGLPATFEGSPTEWRARIAAASASSDRAVRTRRITIRERRIGHTLVTVRIYTPSELPRCAPTLVYLHPGGFISGSAALSEGVAVRLAEQTRSIIVSVDYRLAPESPFPAALEDTCAVIEYIAEHMDEFGNDVSRIALVGESAGGSLVASAALIMRDRKLDLAAQVLICPWTNMGYEYPSQRSFAESYFLTARDLADIRRHYMPDVEQSRTFPVSPVKANTLVGVAPAVVVVAGFDPLLDDGTAYAKALAAQGVPTILRTFDTLIHPFYGMPHISPAADQAVTTIHSDLVRVLDPQR